jgi:hypothetical protein
MRHLRQDVDLVFQVQNHHLVYRQFRQDVVVHLVCDKEMMKVRHQIFRHLDHLVIRRQVVVNHQGVVVVAQQIQDGQNQDEVLPYFRHPYFREVHRDEMVRQFQLHQHLADVVDVDHHRKFQMDYFQDALVVVVDVVRLEFQMDYCRVCHQHCYQDVVELE